MHVGFDVVESNVFENFGWNSNNHNNDKLLCWYIFPVWPVPCSLQDYI